MTRRKPHRPSLCLKRCRGSVMIEMVLVLPLVLTILAILFFMGRGMMRLQRAQVMDRYEAWRSVSSAEGPRATVLENNGLLSEMNDTFFGGNAAQIYHEPSSLFPTDAADALTDAAGAYSNEAHALSIAAFDVLPRGATALFKTTHSSTVPLYNAFEGPMRHRHVRLGNDWRAANGMHYDNAFGWVATDPQVHHNSAITNAFYLSLEKSMIALSTQSEMAHVVRSAYHTQPPYQGPFETALYE